MKRIREVVKTFGKEDLGFDYTEIGTHSIRSSTAMQLFLNKYPTYQIMLLGRWCSDSFLKYIRRQVLKFSAGISESMVQKDFYTVPDVEYVDPNDPRTRSTASFATASTNGGHAMGAHYHSGTHQKPDSYCRLRSTEGEYRNHSFFVMETFLTQHSLQLGMIL